MFKHAIIYKINSHPTSEQLLAMAESSTFTPCGPTKEKSWGWVPPRGEAHGALVEVVDGQYILKFQIETKTVPGQAVKRKADELAAQIEAETGRKPGKKELKSLREDTLMELLPNAIPKQSSILVWIDPGARTVVMDCASQSKADDVATELVKSIPGLHLKLLETELPPQDAMVHWLRATIPDEWPAGLSVERECELKGGEPDKSVVKFTRHSLLNDEIRLHISQGKLPTKLALSWEGRVGFVLTDGMQLKNLAFLEGVFDGPYARGTGSTNKADCFDTNVAIITGELRLMIAGLVYALGGEVKSEGGAA